MNKKLSTDPYKGVRDFYPEEYAIQEYLYNTMAVVAERYGYIRYDSSPLEPAELYKTKTSEEIISEQTYTFEDRGGRSVTLRPEMTPTITRMVAAKRRELPFPLRWYSIPNLFRYERPQRGRLREHRQLNVDIFGIADQTAEEEIITLAYDLLTTLGLQEDQFEIQINDREALIAQLETLVEHSKMRNALQLVDKKSRLSSETFQKEWKKISKKPFSVTTSEKTKKLKEQLVSNGIKNIIDNPELARGFDYYTGTVFEIFDTGSKNNRSLCGGGRYDNLLELFNQDPIPAVGFGMGDVTMRDILETYNLLPEYIPMTKLCICYADKTSMERANKIVAKLRKQSVNVTTADPNKKVADQIKYADKLKIPFVLCIGKQELTAGTYTLKELATGKETQLAEDAIAQFLLGLDK